MTQKWKYEMGRTRKGEWRDYAQDTISLGPPSIQGNRKFGPDSGPRSVFASVFSCVLRSFNLSKLLRFEIGYL